MATGRKPDPRRQKDRHVHASYLKVPNGSKEAGYVAGQLFGCYTHRTHATQPCLSDLTNDELKCPLCTASIPATWRGYVPVWDRDWALRYCLIGEDYFASVDAIPHRAQVSVSRAKNPISPLVIRAEVVLLRELPDREPWSKPINMLELCLTLWKCDALNLWYQKNPEAKHSDKAVSLKSDGKEFGPMTKAAARRFGANGEPTPMDAQLDAVLGRLKEKNDVKKIKESTNGKH